MFNRVMQNYQQNIGKYSCEAPREVFKNCDASCPLCRFSKPKEKPFKGKPATYDDSYLQKTRNAIVDMLIALPDDEAELCLKMLEERLAGVSSYVGDANVAE